jgi:putative copper export protein
MFTLRRMRCTCSVQGFGSWIGALVPLLFVLGRARVRPDTPWHGLACIATRRFSTLGLSAAITLLVTGLINAFDTPMDASFQLRWCCSRSS